MKVGAAIYSMLKDDSAVSALVGTRIYPELAEEGASTPYVVYSVVSNTPVDTKDSAPVDESQLEVFSVANTYAAANDLADKVRAALSRQEKVVYDTVTVQSIKYTNEVTEVSAERNMYISVQDYTARTVGVIARPSFLFDSYGGALGAYSLRQLNSSYTDAAVTVRRESDNATKDIGFDVYGNLQQGELEAFCAGTNGFVSVWKDQSGNGNDATQTTPGDQPQIVSSGVVLTVNNKPSIYFDDTTLDVNTLSGQSRLDVYVAYKTTDINYILFSELTAGGNYSWVVNNTETNTGLQSNYIQSGTSGELYRNGAQVSINYGVTTRADLYTALVDGNLNLELHQNVRTDAWSAFGISRYYGARVLTGHFSELVVYNSDQSANRTGIESNIMTHYSIT
jgi:hypothetical protein